MPEARVGHSMCALGGMLFVAGGIGRNSVVRYDPGLDTWSEVAAMASAKHNFGLFALGGLMYAVDKQGMEVYDPATSSWSVGQATGVPRDSFAACTVKMEVNVFDAMMARARRG